MSTLGSARRYYLAKRHAATSECELVMAATWQAKQEAEPGEDLPSGFPSLSTLETKGYTTYEDLAGADVCELQEQGFTTREAEAILAATAE